VYSFHHILFTLHDAFTDVLVAVQAFSFTDEYIEFTGVDIGQFAILLVPL
jgi:hypothetical protein